MNNRTVLLFHSVENRDLLSLKNLGNIRPDMFERILAAVKKEFDVVSLAEIVLDIKESRAGQENLLAVTFDDGPKSYATDAAQIMNALDVPSTCFLITDCVGDEHVYWRYFFNYCVNLGHAKKLAAIAAGEYGLPVREDEFLPVTRRNFDSQSNRRILEKVKKEVVGEREYREQEHDLFLSGEDIQMLNRNPLVRFGIHTRTHPVMAALSDDEIRSEIAGSILYFKEKVKNERPMFSVPFGRLYRDYDERTVLAARELSLEVILSAYGGGNGHGQPLYNIRRIPVTDTMLSDGMRGFLRKLKDARTSGEYAGAEQRLDKAVTSRGSQGGSLF